MSRPRARCSRRRPRGGSAGRTRLLRLTLRRARPRRPAPRRARKTTLHPRRTVGWARVVLPRRTQRLGKRGRAATPDGRAPAPELAFAALPLSSGTLGSEQDWQQSSARGVVRVPRPLLPPVSPLAGSDGADRLGGGPGCCSSRRGADRADYLRPHAHELALPQARAATRAGHVVGAGGRAPPVRDDLSPRPEPPGAFPRPASVPGPFPRDVFGVVQGTLPGGALPACSLVPAPAGTLPLGAATPANAGEQGTRTCGCSAAPSPARGGSRKASFGARTWHWSCQRRRFTGS